MFGVTISRSGSFMPGIFSYLAKPVIVSVYAGREPHHEQKRVEVLRFSSIDQHTTIYTLT
jgi:hypothetical protein